jgi:hypothetical protein
MTLNQQPLILVASGVALLALAILAFALRL